MYKKLISIILIFFLIFLDASLPTFADEIDEYILPIQEETETGSTDTQINQEINIIPDIIIDFQSPSYLTDKDIIQDTYYCDKSKPECKVNFDITDTFGGYIPAKYTCENDFSIITGEETKCNPSTIVFPYGNHKIKFKINEKDNLSNFKEKIITIINDNPILDNPETSSGTIIDGEIQNGTGSIETSSGSLSESGTTDTNIGSGYIFYEPITSSGGELGGNLGTGQTNSGFIEIPDINIEIQSGLEIIDSKYQCKSTNCKINLNLDKVFTGSYNISKYSCTWNFGSGTFTTLDTDKKCNPGFVDYGIGNFVIEAKISEKNNLSNFKTGSLVFYNGKYDDNLNLLTELPTSTGGVLFGSGLEDTSSGGQSTGTYIDNTEISSGGVINNSGVLSILPSIKIDFQSPSYILNKEIEKDDYECDNSKNECSINFDLSKSFSGFTQSHYICFIDLPFESTEIDKCNPKTIIFPSGDTKVGFNIYEKDNPSSSTGKTIIIHNFKTHNPGFGKDESLNNTKDIIIQSGAQKITENEYECSDEKCKINLLYENTKDETCIWDFDSGIYKDTYKTSCNPSFLYYYSGNYTISLKTYKNGLLNNEKSINLKNNFLNLEKESNLSPIAKIKLQGNLSKNKELIGNKLICSNSKTCSVNFDGSESYNPNKGHLEYYWDFGNGEFSEKENPSSIKYIPGKYKIKLKVTDSVGKYNEDFFYVDVYEKIQEITEINDNIIKYIKLIEALPNPIGSEKNEWIKIKNDSNHFINIKGLEIDDKIDAGSKSYVIKNDCYLFPYQEKKFYKTVTKINLNNSFDEVNLVYNKTIIDYLSWNYEVPEGYIVKKSPFEKVKVNYVIDGDTIQIVFLDGRKEKLRLIGVDTPETKHPKKEVEKFGIEASNYTKEVLLGKDIYLELDYENYRDKYGRLLGYVWIKNNESIGNEGDILFNKLLIEKGYGRAYLYFPFKYKKDFEESEKKAKKMKLGIWGNKELVDEIKLLEKIEKNEIDENIKFDENIGYQKYIRILSDVLDTNNIKHSISDGNLFNLVFYKADKKSIEKESINEFDELLSELIPKIKKSTKTNKIKQEKVITYRISKLKSGLKITGNTFSNSKIILNFDNTKYETKSDQLGKYTFLISDNLKVGEFKIDFIILSGEKEYKYLVSKTVILSKDYILGVQGFKLKQANKKLKKKKVKKKRKKKNKLAKNNTKKLKYNIKELKKEEDKSSSSKNIIYIFLISLITSVLGFFVIKKFD